MASPGYARINEEVRYGAAAKRTVAQRINQMVEMVREVDGVPIRFVRAGEDKHSVFYALEAVEAQAV